MKKIRLNPDFCESVILYCLRVIEQSKLQVAQDPSLRVKNNQVGDIALLESVRILDNICLIDPSKLTKVFPVLKKVVSLTTHKEINMNFVILATLQFFINHAEDMV